MIRSVVGVVVTAALLFVASLLTRLTLSRIDLVRFLFALVFHLLLITITTQCIEIVCVVFEHVVFIFAAVRGLLPETMSCRIGMWRRMSITKDRGREHQHRPKELNILVC